MINLKLYQRFKEVIANMSNEQRYMQHKEPTGIKHIAYPDGRIVKYVPPRNTNPFINRIVYPNGKIIN